MRNLKKSKMVIGVLLVFAIIVSTLLVPLQSVLAYDEGGAQLLTYGGYYDLPEKVSNYLTSGKTLEFDLNLLISSTDTYRFRLYDGDTATSNNFILCDKKDGLSMTTTPLSDGWYHYAVTFATISHTSAQEGSSATKFRLMTQVPVDTKINNISLGVDYSSLPEDFTEDYDEVTLADLGVAGTDYKTSVSSGTYTYKGKSETNSVIVKFGWEANLTKGSDKPAWKLALDTYWNEKCMVWFRGDGIFAFFPWDNGKSNVKLDAITSGKHDIEFGRLRVTAGPNYGKDYVFLKIDGQVAAYVYTDYYQTNGGYEAYNGKKIDPSYTVCFVDDTVSKQGFSGFALPDEFVSDIDYVNIGDIAPGGVVKDTIHDGFLGYTYPFTSTSKTHSTVVRGLLKTGDIESTEYDGSVMVIDIGGNCGFCRSYIPAGSTTSVMFGWEIDGCTSGTKNYKFEGNSWYAIEQGRLRVVEGINKGKDYVYLKINGDIVSYFYGNPESRPFLDKNIYVEATQNFQIVGYNELRAKYYVDDELYLDGLAQKGFVIKKPDDPKKDGQFFKGWYTEKIGGTLFDFENTKLTDDINLYAHFTTETVQLTYNNNNGGLISNVASGKGCLVAEPSTPAFAGSSIYEQVFVGWKNETTGKIHNFKTDRISGNTIFTAQYKEKEYFVSYYANGKFVNKVPFVLSNPTVAGKEPAVPEIPNTTGEWASHATSGLTGNITVNAVYTVKSPSPSSAIRLTTYGGDKIYLNTDTIHDYLTTDISQQTTFVREFCASPHTYQDHQNTQFKWSDSGSNSQYTVYFADNKDFKNAYIYTTAKTTITNEVGIFVPGKTYYWYVCGNNTGKCSEVDSFTVVNSPVRYITAGKVTNMRDLGGYETADGSKVKYGLVYRGASLDEYHSHIDDTARGVFNYLGMKSEIELRGGCDHDFTGWDENNSNVNYISAYAYEGILTMSDSTKAQYKETFEKMADEKNYPFYFHCSAGADRTGAFGYLLNGLLGVPYDNLREDYELTSFSEVGLRPADSFSDGSFDNLKKLMVEQYGKGSDNVQTAIENYLKEYIGVSDSVLTSIKNIMLDKTPTPNEKPHKITVDILGKKTTYQAFDGIYFMPESPKAVGKIFKGFYNGATKYNGYAKSDLDLVAKFDDIQYEDYDTITLKDLGITDNKILNKTNSLYSYEKTAASGGRLLQFVLQPIGNMNNGDGPQIALTNDWSKNSFARVWFQNNTMSYVYYSGIENSGPDVQKMLSLEADKQYDIRFAVRVMKNAGYEGKKILEVTVNGELFVQYIGCEADLSDNKIFFHGSDGSSYLINKPVYKTVNFYNGNSLIGSYQVERGSLLPTVSEPAPQNGTPFAGWTTVKSSGVLWDEYSDIVYNDVNLYAYFAFTHTVSVDILGEKRNHKIFDGVYFMPDAPQVNGKIFRGFYSGNTKYNGYANGNISIVANYEDIQYEDYDTISLKDLGIKDDRILNKTNTVYTYEKTAASGGRLFQFVLEPIGNMNNGDGPQIALTNDWEKNSCARLWLQSNKMSHIYYNGAINSPPDLSVPLSLEAGKKYDIVFAVRVMKNAGYEGEKVFEVSVNGEILIQYIGCKADLSENLIYFHGSNNSSYLINKPVYKTVNFYDGDTLLGSCQVERNSLLPQVKEPSAKNGLPFAGWYTEKSGGKLWDENADLVYNDMNLYAHFANVRVIKADVDGKILTYRVEVGKTLEGLPKPKKQGHVFMGWTVNGKLFTGKVTDNMSITALFEAYIFDDYDEISLRDLGIYNDLDFAVFSENHNAEYTYRKAAKTGGRVFKAIYIPTENMINGPQISFSKSWDENYFAKLYFTKYDKLYVYSSGIDGGLPTLTLDTELIGGKEYLFEVGVRVLKNKGYKGIKVFTVYINGELIFEEFDNKANIDGDTVFFQGLPNTGFFRGVDIYKTVSFYDGDNLLASVKVLRGEIVKSIGNLADKGDRLFKGWFTEYGEEWDFDVDCVYLDTVLKAKYQKRTYPVLLMVDGIMYKRLNVSAGECIEISDIPTKDGYEFEKWLNEDGSDFNMQTKVNAPITLLASFKKLPAVETAKQDGITKQNGDKKAKSSNLVYILLSILGIAIIAAEIGLIVYKKRSK